MSAFVDTNLIVYASGRSSTYQGAAMAVLAWGVEVPGTLCSSSEVLQELLHLSIRRAESATFNDMSRALLTATHDFVVAVNAADVVAAARLDVPGLSARDRVHAAVMQRIGVTQIISTDRAFDRIPTITRLDPLRFEEWRDSLLEHGE